MMNSEMKFSIIIPYFNIIHYLERMLDSMQGIHEDTEVIVVNDHSTENIEEWNSLRKRYADDPRFLFCDNKEGHKGAGAARNVGMERASGKWLLFADADDAFIDIEQIYQYVDSDADLIYFPSSSMMDDGSPSNRHEHYQQIVEGYLKAPESREAELTLRTQYWGPVSKLVRREFVRKNDFWYEEIMYGNDTMFSTMTGVGARKIDACPNPIYCIYERAGSLTQETTRRVKHMRRKTEIRMAQYIFNHLENKDRKIVYKGARGGNVSVWLGLHFQWVIYYWEALGLLGRGEL